ncbi:MAG: hypothetical protein K6G26_08915, partial [Lachnospiraceae bacterium]|nr:hypothetical protein [Lachnospiraceae bacterium]
MYINGFIIQEYIENSYKGIDGSGFSKNTGRNWFLEDKEFEDYYDEHIGLTYYDIEDSSWIAVCNDINFIRRYIKKAEEHKIQYRILLVESDIPNP